MENARFNIRKPKGHLPKAHYDTLRIEHPDFEIFCKRYPACQDEYLWGLYQAIYLTCSKCGEPLSLPLKGFEDKAITDVCYCVGCRPEETKQLRLQIKGSL